MRTRDMVEDNRNDTTITTIGSAMTEEAPSMKRKYSEITESDAQDEDENGQTQPKRARVDVEGTSDANIITALSEAFQYNTQFSYAVEPSFSFNGFSESSEQNETSLAHQTLILYANKKSIGTKRKSVDDICNKIKQIGRIFDSSTTLQIRTVYWILIGIANCSLKIQPERNPVKIEKVNALESSTLFQIHTPKQTGPRYFEFTSGNFNFSFIIDVLIPPDSTSRTVSNEISSVQYHSGSDAASLDQQSTLKYDNNATQTIFQANIISFSQEHCQLLRTVLEQQQFTQEVASRNFQLWRRRTIHEWNVLVITKFGIETLLSLKEQLSLVDGVLVLLPKQNDRNYEVSDIEFFDGNKLNLLTTIGASESIHVKSLSADAQVLVTMIKKENEPTKNFEVSAVHNGSSMDDLTSYIPYWLSIGLKPRLSDRHSLFMCFLYEKEVAALTEYARQILQSIGVSLPEPTIATG